MYVLWFSKMLILKFACFCDSAQSLRLMRICLINPRNFEEATKLASDLVQYLFFHLKRLFSIRTVPTTYFLACWLSRLCLAVPDTRQCFTQALWTARTLLTFRSKWIRWCIFPWIPTFSKNKFNDSLVCPLHTFKCNELSCVYLDLYTGRQVRILVNTPASQGAIGDLYNFHLDPSLTLGCGTWGGTSLRHVIRSGYFR